MQSYSYYVLKKLLDAYERRTISKKGDKRNVPIRFRFDEISMPDYFDERSSSYEEIHLEMENLEEKGLIHIVWRGYIWGHIIKEIRLCRENVLKAYEAIGRKPKKTKEEETLDILNMLAAKYCTSACSGFLAWAIDRVQAGFSVKGYFDIGNTSGLEELAGAVYSVETNTTTHYEREFSAIHLGDSKKLEHMLGKICKILRRFGQIKEEMDNWQLLAEYHIFKTPDFVYIKGNVCITLYGQTLDLSHIPQGIGINGDSLEDISFLQNADVSRIITVENLTSFFQTEYDGSIILYLGGYHNHTRRKLLQKIYQAYPKADYLHFGDIDAGGFQIYFDLCNKTKIPFQPFCMDISTLKKYEQYAKPLEGEDRERLEKILGKIDTKKEIPFAGEFTVCIHYMLEKNIKLEQECEVA